MIEIIDLTKKYGNHEAVKNVSFTLERGKIYGLLGPNGAGKSTTLNMLTGCLAPTDGKIIINGADITKNPIEAKRFIGYLPETPPLYVDMTPREYLVFVANAKGIKGIDAVKEATRVMESTDIIDVQDRLIRHLSKGYCQRIGIAQALIGSPEYIILDEPTVGLDPNQMIEIRELIRFLGMDHTVLLSSHILSEVSNICDEIIVISDGELVANDTPDNLADKFTAKRVLTLTVKHTNMRLLYDLLTDFSDLALERINDDYIKATIVMGENDRRIELFYTLARHNFPIVEMKMSQASLEDIFIELTSTEDAENDRDDDENGGDNDDVYIQA